MVEAKDLIQFENEIIEEFKQGKIKFPIHLSGGNEQQLINIFKKFKIKKNDYLLSTWRNHYHWLLSGRSKEELKRQIREIGSMGVRDKYFITSSIVGGIAPIAVGIALALKKKRSKKRVFCFLGCMASLCGIAKESITYAQGHDLPVTFIIENNNESVYTCTDESWGKKNKNKIILYNYIKKYKHHGIQLNTNKNKTLF